MSGGEPPQMKKHLNLGLALVAGLLGGLLSRYIAPPAAFSQNLTPVTKEIRAQSFVIVDADGRTVAAFAPDPALLKLARLAGQPLLGRILVLDSNGREIWSAGGSPFRAPSER
jgi:hypothetical protein